MKYNKIIREQYRGKKQHVAWRVKPKAWLEKFAEQKKKAEHRKNLEVNYRARCCAKFCCADLHRTSKWINIYHLKLYLYIYQLFFIFVTYLELSIGLLYLRCYQIVLYICA